MYGTVNSALVLLVKKRMGLASHKWPTCSQPFLPEVVTVLITLAVRKHVQDHCNMPVALLNPPVWLPDICHNLEKGAGLVG